MGRYSILIAILQVSSLAVAGTEYDSLIAKASSFQLSHPDSVLFYAQSSLNKDSKNKSDAYYWIGAGLRLKGYYDSSFYWYKLANSAAETVLEKGNASMGLGAVNFSTREFDEALGYFLKASRYYEEIDHQERTASAYANIGIILNANDTNDKAKAYFTKALDMYESSGHEQKQLPVLINLSSLFMEEEMLDSAIYYGEKCYGLAQNINSDYGRGRALVILAPCYTNSGWTEKGYRAAIEGKDIFQQIGVKTMEQIMVFNEAQALYKLNRLDESLKLCQELAAQVTGQSIEERLFELMALVFEARGDLSQALSYQKKFHLLYKDFITEEKAAYIDDLEAKYEFAKNEKEIRTLENQVAIQQIQSSRQHWIIVSIVLVTLLAISCLWFFYQKRISKETERSMRHKQQLLRSQINPHFIFNSLSSIRGFLFGGGDTGPAILYLGKFAKLMRMVLELSSKEWVTLEEEVKALELYLSIQQIRFNNSFDFVLSISSQINTSEIVVPPLTAQPFIENAIEHGLKGMDKHGKVEVQCHKESGRLIFKIQDNGLGIDHVQQRNDHQSRAIQMFKERLGIIGKQMKTHFDFKISDIGNSNAQGTLVKYELPLVKQ